VSWDVRLGDCLDPVTGLASLPDKSVDHVICDPPYEAEAHTLQRRTKQYFRGPRRTGDLTTTAAKPLDFIAITQADRMASAGHMARLARRWIIVFCQAEAVGSWRETLVAGAAVWKRSAIWVQPNGQPQLTGDRPGMGYESIACAHAAGRSRWNGGGKHGIYTYPTDTWMTEVNHGIHREHPTQKPLTLMEALVRDFTDPGETVCERLGRNFIGWEKDPKYHAIAVKRIAAAREQLRMFEPKAEGA
jgi:site-specific DNA-methyltransferase (adenine-specific)